MGSPATTKARMGLHLAVTHPLLTDGVYAASASMVLLNKATLSSFDFNAPIALLFFQCFVCVILVRACSLLGFIKLEPWWDPTSPSPAQEFPCV